MPTGAVVAIVLVVAALFVYALCVLRRLRP